MSIGKHQSANPGTTTWLTPPHIIEALGGQRSFDLDPCAAQEIEWPTAASYYTVCDNGLAKPWHGRVWLNPPYTNAVIGKWMGRLARHARGTALIFARTETRFFAEHVFNSADGLLFIEGRLHFHVAVETEFKIGGKVITVPPGGISPANAGAPSVLVAYGDDDVERLAASNIEGTFMPLTLTGLVPVTPLVGTWVDELKKYLTPRNRPVHLSELYRAFATHRKAQGRTHYRETIRRTLLEGPFRAHGDGQWSLL